MTVVGLEKGQDIEKKLDNFSLVGHSPCKTYASIYRMFDILTMDERKGGVEERNARKNNGKCKYWRK